MLNSLKSVILHLRIPFSWFLLPIFLGVLCISPNFDDKRLGLVFLILHFLVYPAANAFNSYFDKDEKSIGGLKNPPPVNKGLFYTALILDLLAIWLALKISIWFAGCVLIYSAASRMYSHPSVRLKKYPVTGWLFTSFFQGYFTVCAAYLGLNGYEPWNLLSAKVQLMGLIFTLLLMAVYPLTQVYQHEEDERRGDMTMSRKLGIRNTFVLSFIFFTVTVAAFVLYLSKFLFVPEIMLFLASLLPSALFLIYWYRRVFVDPTYAKYSWVMWFNMIAATGMNYYFFKSFLVNTHVLQVF